MKLIIGNWKMYPRTFLEAKRIFMEEKKVARRLSKTKAVICPPHLYVASLAAQSLGVKLLAIGAQNSFSEDEGARTGETSPVQIASTGATYVILGHSERRALGESDAIVAAKAIQATRSKLTVVLCVGEKGRDANGSYFSEVRTQLRASLAGFPKSDAKRLVVAYEPIWAIGTKAVRAATPEDFHEMSILIRRQLVEEFGQTIGFRVPILYGGSVDEKNALGFLREGGADGLLVGRASLDPARFGEILKLADKLK